MFTLKQASDLTTARLFSVAGRTARSEYWWSYLLVVIVAISVNMVTGALTKVSPTVGGIVGLVGGCFVLGLGIVMLFSGIRRLHDRNMSGWWILVMFVPVVGPIIMIVLFCLPGTPGVNRFGINPVEDLEGHYNYYYTKQFKQFGAYGAQNFTAGAQAPGFAAAANLQNAIKGFTQGQAPAQDQAPAQAPAQAQAPVQQQQPNQNQQQ